MISNSSPKNDPWTKAVRLPDPEGHMKLIGRLADIAKGQSPQPSADQERPEQ